MIRFSFFAIFLFLGLACQTLVAQSAVTDGHKDISLQTQENINLPDAERIPMRKKRCKPCRCRGRLPRRVGQAAFTDDLLDAERMDMYSAIRIDAKKACLKKIKALKKKKCKPCKGKFPRRGGRFDDDDDDDDF